jgi:hypothetical protein
LYRCGLGFHHKPAFLGQRTGRVSRDTAVRAGGFGYADLERQPEGLGTRLQELGGLPWAWSRTALSPSRRARRWWGRGRCLISHPLDDLAVEEAEVLCGVYPSVEGVFDRRDRVSVGGELFAL